MDDRIPGVLHPRLVAFYTTSFSLGASGSYFLVGQLVERLPWRAAIAAAAMGPALGWLLVALRLARVPPQPAHTETAPGARWRDVLQSAESMRYVAAYSCHMWELFGMRAWLVPFFVFCVSLHGPTFAAPTTLAALLALAGIPAGFAGAELSARFDRRAVVIALMLLSAAAGLVVGGLVSSSWGLILGVSLLHHALVMSDSAALTSGLVAVSPPQSRGTAMAIYSMAGFGTAAVASFAIGGMLDLLGGQSVTSWPFAFAVMVSSNVLGAALLVARPR
jgi:MFS family permease